MTRFLVVTKGPKGCHSVFAGVEGILAELKVEVRRNFQEHSRAK